MPNEAMIDEVYAVVLAHAEGAHADARFDAGEFSGPAHSDALETAIDAIAAKYNMTRDELDVVMHSEVSEMVALEVELSQPEKTDAEES